MRIGLVKSVITSAVPALFAASILCLPVLLPSTATAQSRISILVNSKAITSYEVSQRISFLRLAGQRNAGKKKAVEELVNEQLMLQEAARFGFTATKSQVNNSYANVARQLNMTPARLTNVLNARGIQSTTLKNRLKAQISWQRAVRNRYAQTRGASSQNEDVTNLLFGNTNKDSNTEKAENVTEYTLQRIVFVLPKKSSKRTINRRKQEAANFRSKYGSCDTALTQAKGLKGVVVQPLQRFTSNTLPRSIAKTVTKTAIGSATAPVATNTAVEIYGVCSTRVLSGSIANADNFSVGQENSKELRKLSETYLADLKKQAVIENR